MKKKKLEVETEMRALLPEQIEECAQKLAGLIRSKKVIKRQAKEAARTYKAQLEQIEEEEERLSQAIITQQEEIPVKRQMTLAEIEDQRRHEESLAEFKRETNAFKLHEQNETASAITAESSDADPEDEKHKCQECGALLPYDCATELCDSCLSKPAPSDASPEVASTAAVPDRNTIEGGLYAALHQFLNATARWQRLRKDGANDVQLKRAIVDMFGSSGGSSGPGVKPIAYKGGKEPAFWFDRQPPSKPTLKGKALVDAARKVLAIPLPDSKSNGKATETDELELVPNDFHHRTWDSLSDAELTQWNTKLTSQRLGDRLREEHGAEKHKYWCTRVLALIRGRDAAWRSADVARGAQ